MGCFLTCFGFEKKKKHFKGRIKSPSEEQNYGSYAPLDREEAEEHISSDPELKEKSNESSKLKIKKKVTFNLDVKAYEPLLQNEEDISSYDSGIKDERNKWDLGYEEDSVSSSIIQLFPQNNRYQNCRDGYDDEDEELMENEFDLDDICSDDELEDGYSTGSNEESLKEDDFPSASFEEIIELQNKELQELESTCHTRRKRQYVFDVLNPVENLTQWKEVKAKAAPPMKRQKENIVLEEQDERSSKTNPDSDSHFQKREKSVRS